MFRRLRLLGSASLLAVTFLVSPAPAHADANGESLAVTCQTASLYANYSPTNGPLDFITTMYAVDPATGSTHHVSYRYSYNSSWDVVFHQKTSQWGFMLNSCHQRQSTTYGRNDVSTSVGPTRRYVCYADNVYVRDQQLRVVGRLFTNQSMAVAWYEDSSIGLLAVGYAYGNTNKYGKMSANFFC